MVAAAHRPRGLAIILGLALVISAGPSAWAQSSSSSDGAGLGDANTVELSPNYPLGSSAEPPFSADFTSPARDAFSSPTFIGIDTTGQVSPDLQQVNDTLDSVMVQSADEAPMSSPLAALSTSLAHQHTHDATYAGQAHDGKLDYDCLPQAQQGEATDRYWRISVLSEPETAIPTLFSADVTTAQQAATDSTGATGASEDWCSASLPTPWSVEPFTMSIWGTVLVLTLGITVFWAVRGFKTP